MNSDVVYLVSWWFVFLVVGIISFPLSYLFFNRFIDLGYGFSKTIGFLIVTYLVFSGGIFRLFPFYQSWILAILVVYCLVNLLILLKIRKKIIPAIRHGVNVILAQEALFSAGYLFWSWVRGYQPDIRGLEKFMDYGFINSILKSEYLPPADMWLAGHSINYYWFGHLWVAVATKLSTLPQGVTYNLMLATILGLTLTAAFCLSATLASYAKLKIGKRAAYVAGVVSAFLLVFAGSLHTPIYALKDGVSNYWYPDATRFIGYHPETTDKTIHEFPQYSFVVSDLHAHLINLPVVLLFLAVLLALIYELADKKGGGDSFSYLLIPSGFLLGIMFMTNAWDFGNYLLVLGVALGLSSLMKQHLDFKNLVNLLISLGVVLMVAAITAFPFILNFESIAQGVAFVNNHTPFWQLGVLWGFPAILTTIYLFFVYKLRSEFKTSDVFVVSLLGASWMLIALPEIIYVKDIYIASHHRANTMFKLTYQAYVMFYLLSGYIAVRTITFLQKDSAKKLLAFFYSLLFVSILSYAFFAVNSYYGGLKFYRGLSGETWLADLYPSEFGAVLWLRRNVNGQAVILEAPADSYTDGNVISAYSGLPTVSGWFVHEWLWRGSPDIPQKRVADAAEIYTSREIEKTKELLREYQVAYVIISTFEREKYINLYEPKFKIIGKPVYARGVTTIYQIQN